MVDIGLSGVIGGLITAISNFIGQVWTNSPNILKRSMFYFSIIPMVIILAWFFDWNGQFCLYDICTPALPFKNGAWGHRIGAPECAALYPTQISASELFPDDVSCFEYANCLSLEYSCQGNYQCKAYAGNYNGEYRNLFFYTTYDNSCPFENQSVGGNTPRAACYTLSNRSMHNNPAYNTSIFDRLVELYGQCKSSGIDYLDWKNVFYGGIGIELIVFALSRRKTH